MATFKPECENTAILGRSSLDSNSSHLVVVLVDGHLQVQAGELAQVAVRVAVLSAEHRADLCGERESATQQ